MNINVAVIDLSVRNRHRLPAADLALRSSRATPRQTLACVWAHDPATGRLVCSWRRVAAREPEQTSPRPTGLRRSPHAALGPVPLAA